MLMAFTGLTYNRHQFMNPIQAILFDYGMVLSAPPDPAAWQQLRQITGFDESAIKALLAHAWPGNVRELDHAVERAVLMAQSDVVKAVDLALRSGPEGSQRLDEMSLEDVECLLIKKALARFNGNVSHAANALGLSRSALYRRLQRYGL